MMADKPIRYGPDSLHGFLFEQALMSAKHMGGWKLLIVCVLASETFTFLITAAVSFAWIGRLPLEFIVIGAIDSFAVSLIICAGLVFMLLRLRETDAALAVEKRRYEATLSSMSDSVCIVDAGFRILYRNDAYSMLLGGNAGDVCYKACHGRDKPCELCPVIMSLKDGGPHRVEKKTRTVSGMRRLDISATPMHGKNGEMVSVIKVARDITEYNKALSNAGVCNEVFRILTDRTSFVAWMNMPYGGRVVHVSPSYTGLWGREMETAYSDPEFHLRYAHPDDLGRARTETGMFGPDGGASSRYRITRPDGETREVEVHICQIMDDEGEVSRIIGTAREVARPGG
jgi:PAS domain S-box-containing protein